MFYFIIIILLAMISMSPTISYIQPQLFLKYKLKQNIKLLDNAKVKENLFILRFFHGTT